VLLRPIRADPNTHGLRVSPRGDKVALQTNSAITIVDRSGARQTLALPGPTAVGQAWLPNGRALWVTAGPTDQDKWILQLGLDGSRREIFHAPGVYVLHDLARSSGAALLHHGVERADVRVKLRGESSERELPTGGQGGAVDVSFDGSEVVVLDQSKEAAYLYPARGGEPRFLEHVWAQSRLSPDGRSVLIGPRPGGTTARLVPIGAGETRELKVALSDPHVSFLDGDHAYWTAYEPGAPFRRGFVQDLSTGVLRPVTPEGVEPLWSPVVAGSVLGRRADGAFVWFPLDGGAPRPTGARASGQLFSLNTTPDGRWTFVNAGGIPARIERIDLVTGRRELWKTLGPPDLTGVVWMNPWVPTAPDGEAYAYTYARVLQDLWMISGLR
jgi:hypothetical protein